MSAFQDQYADGRAAKVWEFFFGKTDRPQAVKDWYRKQLTDRQVKTIADVACGNGVDSMMLLDEGFNVVVSSDASDKMLKYALEERWKRKDDGPAFSKWVIKEANWLTLREDLDDGGDVPVKQFDAVLCVGNSFPHLLDDDGDLRKHKVCLQEFYNLVKPGGYLFLDHRNYDEILDHGGASTKKPVYYEGGLMKDITTSVLYVKGKPTVVHRDYEMDVQTVDATVLKRLKIDQEEQTCWKFRLSYYPHRVKAFTELLKAVFGENAKYDLYADFHHIDTKPKDPAYWMHVIQRPLE